MDSSTGNATAWNPNADNYLYDLSLSGSTIYACGAFTTIGGQARSRVAALDTSTGNATAWNPDSSGTIYSLALDGSTLYVGGNFVTIGGQTRNRIAALDTSTGNATAWNPNANLSVRSLAVSGSTVVTGGAFTTIGGQARNRLAALDASTGNASAWDPDANGSVRALCVSGSTIYAGGFFTTIGGNPRGAFAQFSPDTTAPTVEGVAVVDSTTVDVTFNETMGTGVLTAGNYVISGSGLGTLTPTPDSVTPMGGNVYRLTWFSGTQLLGGDVTITVASVQDLAGNLIGSPDSGTDIGAGLPVELSVFSID